MSTKERILLNQDNTLLQDICGDISTFTTPFKKVIEAFKIFGLGDFNEDLFDQIKNDGGEGIISAYKKGVNAEMDASRLTTQVLRTIILQSSEEPIHDFREAVAEFNRAIPQPKAASAVYGPRSKVLTIDDLSFSDGELIITKEAKENILERHCRIYVDGDNAHALYEILKPLQASLQSYRNILKELGVPLRSPETGGSAGEQIESFFALSNDDNVKLKPESIQWAIDYKASVERMNAWRTR